MTIFLLHGWHTDTVSDTEMTLGERIAEIKKSKPYNEQSTRLRLISEVQLEELPIQRAWVDYDKAAADYAKATSAYAKAAADYEKAWVAYVKAWVDYDKAKAAYEKAWVTRDKARAAYYKAAADCDKARATYGKAVNSPAMQKWHKKFCGCSEWNGTELVFPSTTDENM